jgi:hypothetical protein
MIHYHSETATHTSTSTHLLRSWPPPPPPLASSSYPCYSAPASTSPRRRCPSQLTSSSETRACRGSPLGCAACGGASDPPAARAGLPGAPHQRARACRARLDRRPVQVARRADRRRGDHRWRRRRACRRAPGRHGRTPLAGPYVSWLRCSGTAVRSDDPDDLSSDAAQENFLPWF